MESESRHFATTLVRPGLFLITGSYLADDIHLQSTVKRGDDTHEFCEFGVPVNELQDTADPTPDRPVMRVQSGCCFVL